MQQWKADRVAAVIARLEDAGNPQPNMARLAGVSQSTVNRWARGKVRPGHDAVSKLADAIWRRYPNEARELVEASGYAFVEPDADAQPPPELDDDPKLLEALRRAYRSDPAKVRKAFEAVTWAESLPTGESREAGESSADRNAG